MNATGTGWPGGEFPERDPYTEHVNAKIGAEQLEYITASGEPVSQWVREAIEERIERETNQS